MNDLADSDIVAFSSFRADGDLALTQFAIAILQTMCPAPDLESWKQYLSHPTDPATLQRSFDPHCPAFELDGDGARFMQDFDLRAGDAEPSPIGSLLIDAPGDNALANNTDFFVKRRGVERLCPSCAAIALMTLQINGPAGGAGFRTGVRGGGPLTTLLVADDAPGLRRSLWTKLWLNTLTEPTFHAIGGDASLDDQQRLFPWMGPIRKLQPEGGLVAPSVCHPAAVYWANPRRIRLDFESTVVGGCDLCGVDHPALLTQYVERNQGLNFKSSWRHPLTPYYLKDGELLPMHPNPGGIGWRHWIGLVLGTGSTHGDNGVEPARVVAEMQRNSRLLRPSEMQDGVLTALRLEVAGYDMDSAKARCWYAATMPWHHLDDWSDEQRALLRDEIAQWVDATQLVGNATRNAVKAAWFGRDARGDLSFVVESVWSRTEATFHKLLEHRVRALAAAPDDRTDADAVRSEWHRRLQAVALRVFDEHAASGAMATMDPERLKRAHEQLVDQLRGKPLRQALKLPERHVPSASSKASPSVLNPVPEKSDE